MANLVEKIMVMAVVAGTALSLYYGFMSIAMPHIEAVKNVLSSLGAL